MDIPFLKVGGRLVSTKSEEGKELLKWEKPNYNPLAPENRFPQMLYRAFRREDGIVMVGDPRDEVWSRQCYIEVGSEQERQEKLEAGWRETQKEALALYEAKMERKGTEAAHRGHDDRNMSPAARVEAEAVERAEFDHVPEIPEKRLDKAKGRRSRAA